MHSTPATPSLRVRLSLVTLAATALLAGCPHETRTAASVSGEVHDYATGEPVRGARVEALAGKSVVGKALSDSQGGFTLAGLPSHVTILVSSTGHQLLTRPVVLAPGEDRGIDLYVVPPGYRLPDETILFVRGGHIWSVDPAGIHPEDLTAAIEGTAASPTWNRDRTQFAFIDRIPGRTKIYTRDRDGSGGRFLADVPDSASELRWCEDGRQMIFSVAINSSDLGTTTDLEWLNVFTGEQRDLVSGAQESDPAWSPHGNWIAWSRHFPSRPSELWLTRPTGGDQHPFLTGFNAIEPAWSPDGQQLVFSSNREGQWDLYEAALEAPQPRKLTSMPDGGYARNPCFSPLGDEILFESNVHRGVVGEESDLYALNVRTGEIHEVIDDAHSATW